MRTTRSIDVHAHYVPDVYRKALLQHGHDEPDGFHHIPEWSVDAHLATMDRLSIATSLLSISSPGVHLSDAGTIPHAGATLPMVADRVGVFSMLLGGDPAVDVLRDLGRLHFDLAGYPLPRQLDALLTLTTPEHLHYGTDYPFTPDFAVAAARERLLGEGDPPGALMEGLRANTARLFPHLSADPR